MKLGKVTKRPERNGKRLYDDACGLAHALELVGERWAMLVLRELMFGPRRFSELKSDLPGISANVLTQRLAELEERGLVRRKKLPPPASVQVYQATGWALEAAPVIGALGRWAARSPRHDPTLPLSHAAIMLSLQTMIDHRGARALGGKLGFRFGETHYSAELVDGELAVARGSSDGCKVVIGGSPEALAAVIYGGAAPETLQIDGDRALFARFASLFTLPPKAERAAD